MVNECVGLAFIICKVNEKIEQKEQTWIVAFKLIANLSNIFNGW